MNKYWLPNLTCALCLSAGSAHASTSLVLNGDFELGNTVWLTSGFVAVGLDSAYVGAGTFPAGHWAAFFGSGDTSATGVIGQLLTTQAGTTYYLNFDYGKFGTNSIAQSLQVSAVNVSTGQSILSSTVVDGTGSSNFATVLAPYSFTFTALEASTQISFRDVSGGTISTDGVLDNVSVSAVPEPSLLLLFCAGLPLLLALV